MKHQIECYFINRLNGSDDIMKQLEKRKDLTVHTFSCIGNCHSCVEKMHCTLNGERLQADTSDELYELIINKLDD